MLVMMRKEARITQGTPMMRVCSICFFSICHSDLKALSKIRVGRNIARMPLGLSSLMRKMDLPTKPS